MRISKNSSDEIPHDSSLPSCILRLIAVFHFLCDPVPPKSASLFIVWIVIEAGVKQSHKAEIDKSFEFVLEPGERVVTKVLRANNNILWNVCPSCNIFLINKLVSLFLANAGKQNMYVCRVTLFVCHVLKNE